MTGSQRYGVEVRSAQAADAPEVARLLASAGVVMPAREAAERLEAVRVHPGSACLVATGYGGLSGIVALHWAPTLHHHRPGAQVTVLVVDADERRHGIGRLLLKAASQAARLAGCDAIDLVVAPGQTAAEAFCRATGFVAQGGVFGRSLRKAASPA